MAKYLKPQSPLQHKDGDYFYPLTTIDQVIMPDESRLNANLISINLDEAIEGAPNKINADTLQGYTAEDFFNSKSSDIQLNYSVVGGLTKPASPSKNTIWVETDVPITSYVFKSVQPYSPQKGMIWFETGIKSSIAFNELLINNIESNEVKIVNAFQYINNFWEIIPCKIYQNNIWIECWNGELYQEGNFYEGITGGWIPYGNNGVVIFNDTNIKVAITDTSVNGDTYVRTNNTIDLTDYSILKINVIDAAIATNSDIDLVITQQTSDFVNAAYVSRIALPSPATYSISIDNLNGNYYIGVVGEWLNPCHATFNKIWLE